MLCFVAYPCAQFQRCSNASNSKITIYVIQSRLFGDGHRCHFCSHLRRPFTIHQHQKQACKKKKTEEKFIDANFRFRAWFFRIKHDFIKCIFMSRGFFFVIIYLIKLFIFPTMPPVFFLFYWPLTMRPHDYAPFKHATIFNAANKRVRMNNLRKVFGRMCVQTGHGETQWTSFTHHEFEIFSAWNVQSTFSFFSSFSSAKWHFSCQIRKQYHDRICTIACN